MTVNATDFMIDPTIYIVDDDAAIRDALSLLISLKGLKSSVFETAEDFLAVLDASWRGCLLTDLKLPGLNGLELLAAIRHKQMTLPVVVLTAHGDVATTRTALKNGALDFIEKPVDDDMLIDVLLNALRIDAEQNLTRDKRAQTAARIDRLTKRERDVLVLLAQGKQHRDIAAELAISPRTVEVYKARMMEKLQCHTLADVIRIGAAANLLLQDGPA